MFYEIQLLLIDFCVAISAIQNLKASAIACRLLFCHFHMGIDIMLTIRVFDNLIVIAIAPLFAAFITVKVVLQIADKFPIPNTIIYILNPREITIIFQRRLIGLRVNNPQFNILNTINFVFRKL